MNVVSEVGRPLAGHALSLLKSYKVWKNLNFAEKIKFVEVTDASLKSHYFKLIISSKHFNIIMAEN